MQCLVPIQACRDSNDYFWRGRIAHPRGFAGEAGGGGGGVGGPLPST